MPMPITLESSAQERQWPSKFKEGQKFDRKALNRSYIEVLREPWRVVDADAENELDEDDCDKDESEDDEDENLDEPKEDTCLARIFMRGRVYFETTDAETSYREVEGFCSHIGLDDLKDDVALRGKKSLALLDEVSETGELRENRRRMNSGLLYRALQADRFAAERRVETQTQGGQDKKSPSPQPDTDRRRLFMHNITAHGAVALMATASECEVPAVRGLLSQHLKRDTEIGVSIPPSGFRTFTFSLSIPYYSKKKASFPDARRTSNGDLLRTFVDLPVLASPKGKASPDVEVVRLHEAQTTIVLTGFDERRWTVIGLVDSPDRRESVRYYDSLTDGKQRADPIARGESCVDWTTANPRLYFLQLWQLRIGQADAEWGDIVKCVDQAVKQMWRDDALTLESRKYQSNEISELLRNSVIMKAQLASKLKLPIDDLSKAVSAWSQFQKGDIEYFQEDGIHPETSSTIKDFLCAIGGVYSRLKLKLEALENLVRGLGDNHLNNALSAENSREIQRLTKQNLEASQQMQLLSRENLALVNAQERAGELVRRLTNTSVCFLPFMLAFGLFSMSPTVLPFAPNWQALAFSLALFMGATLLLVNFFDIICSWIQSKSKIGSNLWGLLFKYLGSLTPLRRRRQEATDPESTTSRARPWS